MSHDPESYLGTTWVRKLNPRTVQIESLAPRHGGENTFVAVDASTGQRTRIGFTTLLNRYRRD